MTCTHLVENMHSRASPPTAYLHVGPGLSHGLDGRGADGVDDLLELLRLDVSRLLRFLDFHVVLPKREEKTPTSNIGTGR